MTDSEDDPDFFPIPAWTEDGILPPNRYMADPVNRAGMSPFKCSIDQFVMRFMHHPSPEDWDHRRGLMALFLDYRHIARRLGLTGFQWVWGSFVENVESFRERPHPPQDIDLVNFAYLPVVDGQQVSQFELSQNPDFPQLVKPLAKERFHCDTRFIFLDTTDPEYLVDQCRYWITVASHRRITLQWKGSVRVELSADEYEDEGARRLLETR